MRLTRGTAMEDGSALAARLRLQATLGEAVARPPAVVAAERLWGEGFLAPGGRTEVLEHASTLGLSANTRLLLLRSGLGGPARALALATGCTVLALEADPALRALAAAHPATGLEARVEHAGWDPTAPDLPARAAHHVLAMEPLRGLPPEPLLASLAGAVKPRGHLVLVELVAGTAAPDGAFEAWWTLEERGPLLPGEAQLTRAMGRLGFAVREVEDVSERHATLVTRRSQAALRSLDQERPDAAGARVLLTEAERWRLRLSLLEGGQVTLRRWHAVATG